MKSTAKTIPRALLVSIRTPEVTEKESNASIQELERLVTTLGFRVVGHEFQRQAATTGATAVGAGKLKELARLTVGHVVEEDDYEPPAEDKLANIVVFDCDLRPTQLKNLENALGVEVLDRTGVIIEIFSRHAKTRAARLQVEIARLNYLSPRLRETGSSGERQQGRGSGESALATERRAIRDRLAELKKELSGVQRELAGRRNVRAEQRSVALVGYTNAGKSSTMRALTGSDVMVEDKLFATLDTTVRALKPEVQPRILVSDTVGFIKKLPHDLVASFRSTLDEAANASLLLYLVDASDPDFRAQMQVIEEVLHEVGVDRTPVLLVLNKIDQVKELGRRRLKRDFPDAIQISTRRKEDIRALRERIISFFENEMAETRLFAPWNMKGLIGEIREHTRVLRETHGDDGIDYLVRAGKTEIDRLRKKYKLPLV